MKVAPAARNAIAIALPAPAAAQPAPRTIPTAAPQPTSADTRPRRCATRTSGMAASGTPSAPKRGSTNNAENAAAAARAASGISRRPGARSGRPPNGSDEAIASTTRSVRGVGQQSDRPGALDGRLELPLMERAGPRDAPRKDLAPLRDEPLEQLHVLPVDVLELFRAELAD